VTAAQYIFTHKQYTEQHNVTEYPEQNMRNNKNTYTRIHKQYTEQHSETEYPEQNIHNNKNTCTNSTQNNTMRQNTQNRTYITIRIHKRNN
jgi:hypothetical protein